MLKMKSSGIQSYWLMLVATVITVSIVTSSQLLTQRISLLLDRQASELLAADLVVVSGEPISSDYQQQAEKIGLDVANIISFRTAIFIDDSPQLVAIKAVDNAYPLRGYLEISKDTVGDKLRVEQGPKIGEIWVDPKLSQLMSGPVTLGSAQFKSDWILTFEPDRGGGSVFNLSPRILMNIDDLASTGLIVPGSRANYRLLFSGQPKKIIEFTEWLKPNLKAAESLQDLENARPEMRQSLDRTRQFFSLSIVLTLVIAMVAIAITARHTANQEAPKVAMLRAFGISQSRLMRFYAEQLGKVWIIATLMGLVIGWFSQYPLQWLLDTWFGKDLPVISTVMPYINAAIVGFISLIGFSLPFLFNATATPPMQVFRPSHSDQSIRRNLLIIASAIFSVFLVLIVLVQSSKLAVVTLVMILAVALVLPAIFYLMINTLLFSGRRQFWLRQYLLSRLKTKTRGALAVMSGFCLALLAILLIGVVKDELLNSWEKQLPEEIPNYFLINLRTDEVPAIEQFLQQREIVSSKAYPLVRARLTHINEESVEDIEFIDPRGSHLIKRTFNVSYADKLPDDNEVISGQWIATDSDTPEWSIESGLAKNLGLKLGDSLAFDIAGEVIKAPITSIRTVLWENFKPNFYLMSNRQLLENQPQTWLLGALITDEKKAELKQLIKDFPSVTLLDITELMSRIRGIVSRATSALEFFFLFAMASAFIVLMAAIQTGRREREQESSLLRALSASSGQLYKAHIFEFTLMGILIGFFAALFASIAGWVISVQFFNIEYHFSSSIWLYGILSSTLVLTTVGTLVSRKVYHVSPMKTLRS
ncbi:MAG: putative ABC transport system permease protein [Candidatus Azotimanducaceae bacterium]|jgi:putative ABC transport system permease protein